MFFYMLRTSLYIICQCATFVPCAIVVLILLLLHVLVLYMIYWFWLQSTFASSILMNSVVKDTWLPEWTEDAEVACQRWANDSSWGALRKGPRHAKCSLNRLSAFFSTYSVFGGAFVPTWAQLWAHVTQQICAVQLSLAYGSAQLSKFNDISMTLSGSKSNYTFSQIMEVKNGCIQKVTIIIYY